VVHSSSKYINGGGNSISGIIVDSGNFKWDNERYPAMAEYKHLGKFCYLGKLRNGLWRNVGCCLAPMNAYMNSVGLETLGIRMERICNNALALARFFQTQPNVKVNYPALKESSYYSLAEKYFGGKGGGIITIGVGSKERAFKLLNSLKLATNATNIGDIRTLVIHPASTIYAHNTEQQKINAGVYEDTIRISVGIEDIEDLIEDFEQALSSL
jgi:O-acetylhomoserine (thiol)-lyase